MAISIYELLGFTKSRISDFFDGDSDQFDPCFAAFKRINDLLDNGNKLNKIIYNLELADKLLFKIDYLTINKNHFDDLRELYKDKDPNLMIENLEFDYYFEHKRAIEDIEFINQISPKIITIDGDIWTVESIKALTLLNWANINLNFGISIKINIYLWFVNTPIQLFDSQSEQMLTFEWESIKILIEKDDFEKDEDEKNGIEEVKLFKTKTGNFLFIPLATIYHISCSGFREILREDDINEQFVDLGVHLQFKVNGLIIPMGYSNRIFIMLDDYRLDYLNIYKDINKIFKEKHIELKIGNLYRLLEIKKLLPEDFSNIKFKYIDRCSTKIAEYSVSKIMDDPDWINLKFIKIYQSSMLLPDEFQFWWKMLRSRRTRFSLTTINLKLNLFSEWLTVLSLCSDCPELKSVCLGYFEKDIENVYEANENVEREFRQKFGYIQKLYICKNDE